MSSFASYLKTFYAMLKIPNVWFFGFNFLAKVGFNKMQKWFFPDRHSPAKKQKKIPVLEPETGKPFPAEDFHGNRLSGWHLNPDRSWRLKRCWFRWEILNWAQNPIENRMITCLGRFVHLFFGRLTSTFLHLGPTFTFLKINSFPPILKDYICGTWFSSKLTILHEPVCFTD